MLFYSKATYIAAMVQRKWYTSPQYDEKHKNMDESIEDLEDSEEGRRARIQSTINRLVGFEVSPEEQEEHPKSKSDHSDEEVKADGLKQSASLEKLKEALAASKAFRHL